MSTAKLKKQILVHLDENPMSLSEIAEVMELKEKRTFKLLRSLFQKDEIKMIRDEDGARKYIKYKEG
jgi:predicted transcriptional regulator